MSAEYLYEIYSGLVTLADDLTVIPDLAEGWDTSPDGTVFTFTLRSGRFHDGTAVTSEDVRWSLERACDPATAPDLAGTYLGDVVGCADKLAGRAASVDGVRAPDPTHVVLRIDAPKAYFLAKLVSDLLRSRSPAARDGRRLGEGRPTAPGRSGWRRTIRTPGCASSGTPASTVRARGSTRSISVRSIGDALRERRARRRARRVVRSGARPGSAERLASSSRARGLGVSYIDFNDAAAVRRRSMSGVRSAWQSTRSAHQRPSCCAAPCGGRHDPAPGMPGFDPRRSLAARARRGRSRAGLAASRYAAGLPPITITASGGRQRLHRRWPWTSWRSR
ncbi:MAG: ABC transporter substrate-binding protein [Anaerolineae bacterium]